MFGPRQRRELIARRQLERPLSGDLAVEIHGRDRKPRAAEIAHRFAQGLKRRRGLRIKTGQRIERRRLEGQPLLARESEIDAEIRAPLVERGLEGA